ncbi:MAG: DNA methyltransferase [Desulfobacca sp.]|nr:DNA methyltransferase [Desulfobacca sp.]
MQAEDNLTYKEQFSDSNIALQPKAIEDGFPFEEISEIAEIESWRKEIYRPIYHIHKWWAQRLGSIFRGVILGASFPSGKSIMDIFYKPVKLPEIVVFDPFMGSGTIVGEAHKLGCTVIGRDINPVAFRAVKIALGPLSRKNVEEEFKKLELKVGKKICNLYKSKDSKGKECDVLYYFWVKVTYCPACGNRVELFPSFIFARHAYIEHNPKVHVVCPECGFIFSECFDSESVSCKGCGFRFNPKKGWAKRTTAICKHCSHEFPIAQTIRVTGNPPAHKMFAKLVLRQDKTKEYLTITNEDIKAYAQANAELLSLEPALPRIPILDGYNTRQIINYGYKYWHELFNERQLLALTLLATAIQDITERSTREAFSILFSGTLEFNNMFASYKGEGTGAIRHMFSHHILKPERTPIEANIWGTPKSSGAFSTLYRSRLLRAIDYRAAPFEVAVKKNEIRKRGRKVFGISSPMGNNFYSSFPEKGLKSGDIYLSCGDSANIDLPDKFVNLVITDPPFFDNVHYSELADFFYVWQELYFNNGLSHNLCTTRRNEEVQDVDPSEFSKKLKRVFKECNRVLRDDGLLVFSYHHSREEGWTSVAAAVVGAGFSFIQSQPVKSEMAVAAPKSQAKSPIDIDVLFVCRKKIHDNRPQVYCQRAIQLSEKKAALKIQRFNDTGRKLSKNDVRVILFSQLLVELSPGRDEEKLSDTLKYSLAKTRSIIDTLWGNQHLRHKYIGNLNLNF